LKNSDYIYPPSELLINGITITFGTDYTISVLTEETTSITLKWEEESDINNCSEMFAELENLIEVDFSNFKFSSINTMNNMFKNCINLDFFLLLIQQLIHH
jgi:hypothetical protein